MEIQEGFTFEYPELALPWGIARRELLRRIPQDAYDDPLGPVASLAARTGPNEFQRIHAIAFGGVPVLVDFFFCKNERLTELRFRRRFVPCDWPRRLTERLGEADEQRDEQWTWLYPGVTVRLAKDGNVPPSEGINSFELVRIEAERRLSSRIVRLLGRTPSAF